MFDTPILFIVFNRPDTTQRVFDKIKELKPTKFYITSDAPRVNNEEDIINNELVRNIVKNIDWVCDVKRLYAKENLGFSRRIKSALEWFFAQEEMGIILEDDCLPSDSFFKYCEVLLHKFKDEEDISIISGSNFYDGCISNKYDFYTSNFTNIWGWASWSRVVNNIQWDTNYTIDEINQKMIQVYNDKEYCRHFMNITKQYYKKTDCWDVEFFIDNLMKGKKGILPNINQISNIGSTGTHFNGSVNGLLFNKTFEFDFSKFNASNYSDLNEKLLQKVIKSFNKKCNPLSIRDRLYIFRMQILNKLIN